MLPWTLAEAGHDLSGRSLLVEVSGAGEGTWHWGLGAGEVPGPTTHADVTIKGRAPQLALVAGKRIDPEVLLESGILVLGGDIDTAELVLRTMRAYV
jgi:hypothetical protein